jgi:hypothetical protein
MPDEVTDATAASLLLHVPPEDAVANVIVVPGHTVVGPLIAAGDALMVSTVSDQHPVASK